MCDALFDHDWMEECRSLVSYHSLIENCYVDYCQVPEQSTLTDIYEAFFASCRDSIGDQRSVCTWKKQLGLINDNCENGKEWSSCGTECDALRSCDEETSCDSSMKTEGMA